MRMKIGEAFVSAEQPAIHSVASSLAA